MAERADESGVIPAQLPVRRTWHLAPGIKRLLTMPLRDPFAFAGILIYLLFVIVAMSADQLAPVDPMEILFTKAGKVAANTPPSALQTITPSERLWRIAVL